MFSKGQQEALPLSVSPTMYVLYSTRLLSSLFAALPCGIFENGFAPYRNSSYNYYVFNHGLLKKIFECIDTRNPQKYSQTLGSHM
jgi:hypothetical protein